MVQPINCYYILHHFTLFALQSQESCLSILTGEPSSTTPLLSSQRRHPTGGHSPGSQREERRGREREPSTAPPPTRGREHFTFDPPQSPMSARSSEKSASHFSFKSYGNESGKDMPAGSVSGGGAGGGGGPGTGVAGNGGVAASEGDEEDDERSGESVGNRSKKLRPRERDPNHISPSVSPSHSRRASPKREKRRTTPIASTGAIAKVSSAPPTMKEANFFGSSGKQKPSRQSQNIPPHQLSPSAQQRKYSSSSSSGSSERCLREATGPGTMFPFDREALDYERIQRECFAPCSTTASNSSDSEAENCSVYERKSGADIFQQYSRLSHQEQLQQHYQERDRPPSRKNSKRIRPDSVIHTTIRENQQYVPQVNIVPWSDQFPCLR